MASNPNMIDPNQLSVYSPMAVPRLSAPTPIAQGQEQRVQTYKHILDMKDMLHKLLRKVEALEQKKSVRRYDDPTGCSNDVAQISLPSVTGQIEKMAKDQAAYLAGTQQAVTNVLSAQQQTGIAITKINESSRQLQEQVQKHMEINNEQYQHVINCLSSMQAMIYKRLDDLERNLSSETQRINNLEKQVHSKVESIERNNQQFGMMLANVQGCVQQIEQISETLNTEFTKMTSEMRRQDKSVMSRVFGSWGSSPGKEHDSDEYVHVVSSSPRGDNTRKLKRENEHLRQQISNMNDELQRVHSSLNKVCKEKESLKCAVMKVKGEIEGALPGRKTVSQVTLGYGKLFTNHCKHLRTALKESKLETDLLVNEIFQVSYVECRSAVLTELLQELFSYHGPDDEDMAVAEAQKKLYGQLLGLKHKKLPSSFADCSRLTHEVLKRVGIANQDDASSDALYQFAQEAVKTALDMIMMQPPMVIEYPHTFDSDIYEKQPGAWDDTLQEGEYQLEYFRPVLYSNYHAQHVLTPGLVGNRPKNSWE